MSKIGEIMQLPITISNIHGEKLTFVRIFRTDEGEFVETEGEVAPKAGPPMHVHWKQDESFTVVSGHIGYRLQGEKEKFADVGETVLFRAGTPHKFWNAGNDILKIKGWVSPPANIIYFLAELYRSMNEHGGRPGTFDAAWLLKKYKSEYKMCELPAFVERVIFPVSLFFGSLTGKGKKFQDAPAAF